MDFKQAFRQEYKYYPTQIQKQDPQVISRLYKINKENIQFTQYELEQSRVLRFFPVMIEGATTYYGGNQKWFLRKTQNMGGCAPVATANLLACLAAQDEKVAERLNIHVKKNGEETISKRDFTVLMHRAYNNTTMVEVPFFSQMADAEKDIGSVPASLGCDAASFLKGTLTFATENGVALKQHIHFASYSDPEKSLSFIEIALKRGAPVALLTTHNKHGLWRYNERSAALTHKEWEKVRSHFMTIVAVRNRKEKPQLIVSSWGKLYVVDFEELSNSWQSFSAMGAGMFYFTKEDSIEQSRRASLMMNSYFPVTMAKSLVGSMHKTAKNIEKMIKENKEK